MLWVTVEYFDSHITLKIKGDLEGAGVEELERCWRLITCTAPKKPLRVELDGLGSVTPQGRVLIGRMGDAGVELIASLAGVRAMIEEIREANSQATESVA